MESQETSQAALRSLERRRRLLRSAVACVAATAVTVLLAWLWLMVVPFAPATSTLALWLASPLLGGVALYVGPVLAARLVDGKATSPSPSREGEEAATYPPPQASPRAQQQRIAREVHNGVAATLGLWLFVVVFTGTVAMADEAAAVWLTPALRVVPGSQVALQSVMSEPSDIDQPLLAPRSEDLVLASSSVLDDPALESASIWLPTPQRPFIDVYFATSERETQVGLEPTEARVLGPTRSSLSTVAELHTHLLLPDAQLGGRLLAALSVAWLALAASGISFRRIAKLNFKERLTQLAARPLRLGHRTLGWILLVLALPTILSGILLATLVPSLDAGAVTHYGGDRDAIERDWFQAPEQAFAPTTRSYRRAPDDGVVPVSHDTPRADGVLASPAATANAWHLAMHLTDARAYAARHGVKIRRIDLQRTTTTSPGGGAGTLRSTQVCVEAERVATLSRRDLRWCYAPIVLEISPVGPNANAAPPRANRESGATALASMTRTHEPMSRGLALVLAAGTLHFGTVLPGPTIALWLLIGGSLTLLAGSGLSLLAHGDRRVPPRHDASQWYFEGLCSVAAALPTAIACLVTLGLLAGEGALSPRSHGSTILLIAWAVTSVAIYLVARSTPFVTGTVIASMILLGGLVLDLIMHGGSVVGLDALGWTRLSVVIITAVALGAALRRGSGRRLGTALGRPDTAIDR